MSIPMVELGRTEALIRGRAKKTGGTYYIVPGLSHSGVTGTGAPIINTITYYRWYVDAPMRLDQVAFEITSGVSGNVRVGLYRADRDWQPIGPPLFDSGSISAVTGAKTYDLSLVVPPGRYLAAYHNDVAVTIRTYTGTLDPAMLSPTLGASSSMSGLRAAQTYGPLPNPALKWSVAVNGGSTEFSFLLARVKYL